MRKRKKNLDVFKYTIQSRSNELWIPPIDVEYQDVNTSAWFDIKYHKTQQDTVHTSAIQYDKSSDKTYTKAYKVEVLLSKKQRQIVDRWFNSCIIMYNETIKFISKHRTPDNICNYNNDKTIIEEEIGLLKQQISELKKSIKTSTDILVCEEYEVILKQHSDTINDLKLKIKELNKKYFVFPDYQVIRTYGLKDVRNSIIAASHYKEDNKLQHPIPTHIIDCAIKHACANYKSALSNVKNNNISHFKIRKIKKSKPYKVMELEPSYFHYTDKQKNKLLTILHTSLGQVKYRLDKNIYYDLKDIKYKDKQNVEHILFEDIKSACNFRYSRIDQTYTLIIPKTKDIIVAQNSGEIVSIDPGERTFACCLSENEVFKICNNGREKIKHLLNKVDNPNKFRVKEKTKKKLERKYRDKIKHLVSDLHWKAISFLTSRYKSIIIGNLSTKNIINKKSSVLQKTDKRIINALSFFTFRQRLKYKCNSKGINFKEVNESYTSKTCSRCACIKEKLGPVKVFQCNNCNLVVDRDVNGCRGIYFSCY